MVHASAPILAWLASMLCSSIGAAAVEVAANDTVLESSRTVPGAFIVECDGTPCVEAVSKAVQEGGGSVQRKFDSSIFHGLSFEVADPAQGANQSVVVERVRGVLNIWPLQVEQLMNPDNTESDQTGNLMSRQDQGRLGPFYRANDSTLQEPWYHIMTQVDKLHAAGFTGNGIKVNYTHPALGGCFGKGCRVLMGNNFSNEGKAGDPMDCYGHGTEVAGILAGYNQRDGYLGVVPNATILAYRVRDCDTKGADANVIAGWLQAYNDGAQVIVSSTGLTGGNWASSPLATVASRIVARGVPCVVGIGNARQKGLFYGMEPSTGRGVMAVNSVDRKGVISSLSAYGPTWDLDVKPNVVAPGDNIVAPHRNRIGYKRDSGTSFSGPLVAGIIALVGEARGTFDAKILNSLVMTTAQPQTYGPGGLPVPVMQQGGRLVRAWDAAHSTTLIEPASLAFNDTANRPRSMTLRLSNTDTEGLSYQLSNLASDTLYALSPGAARLGEGEWAHATADISISNSSFKLDAGQSINSFS